jgi:methylmalonyl-CoA mutase N-terminal domain/subunit
LSAPQIPHDESGDSGKPATPATSARIANDGRVPIQPAYEAARSAALTHWVEDRLADGPPFRPRFMVYLGLGTPAMTAERAHLLQAYGAESFLFAADLPSQLGFDPDHALAKAQVGRAGVSWASLDDFAEICSRLDFDRLDSVGMLANSIGHVGLGAVHAVLEDHDAARVRVVMQNDPLKEYTARGTEIFDPPEALRIACDCIAYAIDEDLAGFPITVCSNHYDVAGAGPLVALGVAFANAIEYVDEMQRRGYAIADVARKIMIFVNERSDLFVQASLFRMTRVIWAEILEQRYGLAADEQPVLTTMGYSHGLEAAEEPLVNIARCTLSVTGAVLGGIDYLCAAAYDEAARIPSQDAAVMALRTMQVVGLEHGVGETADSLAGATKLSEIDDHVYTEVRQELDEILERGGGIACIENGYVASRLDDGRGVREAQIESGERHWVGANCLRAEGEGLALAGESSGEISFEAVERDCVERVQRARERRDGDRADRALEAIQVAASGSDNLVPPTKDALEAGATIEEIMEATRHGLSDGDAA